MRRFSGYDLYRVFAAIVSVGVLTLICVACSTTDPTATGATVPQVEMLALPGAGAKVPMPPAWMRAQIERRMSQGRVPGFVEVSSGKLRKACAVHEALLGCMVNFNGLKVTYIRSGLSPEVRHMVLVHEYAHDLYDWVH